VNQRWKGTPGRQRGAIADSAESKTTALTNEICSLEANCINKTPTEVLRQPGLNPRTESDWYQCGNRLVTELLRKWSWYEVPYFSECRGWRDQYIEYKPVTLSYTSDNPLYGIYDNWLLPALSWSHQKVTVAKKTLGSFLTYSGKEVGWAVVCPVKK